MPSPSCFASGDPIPLALAISSPHAPALAKLLSSHIGVYLVRKKKLWVNNAHQICVRELLVSQADLFLAHDSLDGTIELQIELRAGEIGHESSWSVDGAAAVEVSAKTYAERNYAYGPLTLSVSPFTMESISMPFAFSFVRLRQSKTCLRSDTRNSFG